jgi:glycosyltransferase involved in cell wall biosynthesis
MRRAVVYSGDIFRLQERGGITRYFLELIARLERPREVVAGLHQSRAIGGVRGTMRAAVRLPAFRGSRRLREPLNRLIDAWLIQRRRGVILHPTYYRDPRGLPPSEPVVATVYDMAHERLAGMFRRPWWSQADPARRKAELCARAQAIVCISQATARDLIELLRIDPGKVRVIPCGAPDWSRIPAAEPSGLREPFFLWVGERRGYKNFDAALAAWAGCRAAAPGTLLCVGGGAFERRERERLAALGVADRVRQAALSDGELRWAYERAAGLLYTSLWEGFGLPVLEAMALGCPVVVSDRAALPEVAGEAGYVVDPADPDRLRAAIERCLAAGREPQRARALREQAARFSWDACAAAHEALYRELE